MSQPDPYVSADHTKGYERDELLEATAAVSPERVKPKCRCESRPMTLPHPGREPVPEDYDGTEGQDYLAAYNVWRERWEPWMRERKERGYV